MLRVSMYLPLAPIFREKKFNYTRDVLDNLNQQIDEGSSELVWHRGFRYNRTVDLETFKDTLGLYNFFSNQDYNSYMLRIEQSNLSWYSNDFGQMEDMLKRFSKLIKSVSKPDPAFKDILQPNIIIKDSDYEYKVTVGATVDPNVAYWLEQNPDKVRIGSTFLDCIKQRQYVKGFYFYVKNDKVLNLVKIILGGEITRIDKFVNNTQS